MAATIDAGAVVQTRGISHWWAQLGPVSARPALQGIVEADVCIVGAGYGGLWTAYELARKDPSLKVVVVEAQIAGYGAAGRNGGACLAQLNGSREWWALRSGRAQVLAFEAAMRDAVTEVGRFAEAEGVDCDYARNGVLMVARNELELARLRHEVQDDRRWGLTESDSRMLDRDEMAARIAVADALGARFNAHCASLNPAKLVRGLADAAERAGVTVYERSPAVRIDPGVVRTTHGEVRARFVIRATEAYSESIETEQRQIVPVRTSMIVTERLDSAMWRRLGWDGREALLAEHPFLHLQKTADDRITIGGDDSRVPYRYGSKDTGEGPTSPRIAQQYRRELIGLFPALRDVRIEQTWQGVFGAARSWVPSVGVDRRSGVGWIGGFVGEGVAASNLAGRTLADLLMERDSELTRLPWVGLGSRRWEPEPLRSVGAGLIWSMRFAGERLEHRTRRPNPLVDLGNRLAGWTGRLG